MQIIVSGRQSGKTTKLIEIASKTDAYIVCHSQHECNRIYELALELNLNINFPITYREFIEHRYYGRGIKGFLIDNADQLIQSMTEVNIEALTMTGVNEYER